MQLQLTHLSNNSELIHILCYRCQALLQGEVDLVSSWCKFLDRTFKILIQAFSLLCWTCHNIAATLVRVRRIEDRGSSNIVLVSNDHVEVMVKTIQRDVYWHHAFGYRPTILVAPFKGGSLGVFTKNEQIQCVIGDSTSFAGIAQWEGLRVFRVNCTLCIIPTT